MPTRSDFSPSLRSQQERSTHAYMFAGSAVSFPFNPRGHLQKEMLVQAKQKRQLLPPATPNPENKNNNTMRWPRYKPRSQSFLIFVPLFFCLVAFSSFFHPPSFCGGDGLMNELSLPGMLTCLVCSNLQTSAYALFCERQQLAANATRSIDKHLSAFCKVRGFLSFFTNVRGWMGGDIAN